MGLLQNPSGWFRNWLGLSGSATRVTEKTTLSYPPAWFATNKIAGRVAQMGLVLKRRVDSGSEDATDHPAYRLMKRRPNPHQGPAVWKTQMMTHFLLWGNARSYIHRAGNEMELIPLVPDYTITIMVDGEKWHCTKIDRDDRLSLFRDMAENPHKVISLRDSEVWHVPALSTNGYTGIGIMEVGGRTLQTGIDAEKNVGQTLAKGFSGRVILNVPPGQLRDEAAARRFLSDFREYHSGPDGAEVGMLRDGVNLQLLQNTAKDSQLIEQRIFTRQDTALLFGLTGILGDDASVSYNSLEQKSLSELMDCLGPILVKWEEESNEKLLTEREKMRGDLFFKFNVAALLKATFQESANTIISLHAARLMTQNECRAKLDLPTIGPAGDRFSNPNIDVLDKPDSDMPAARAHLQHLQDVEKSRIRKAITSKVFNERIDRFYESWSVKMADSLQNLGGDPTAAEDYCEANKSQLLAIYDSATPATFGAEVEQLLSTWTIENLLQAV